MANIEIIYLDENVIAVNKPVGMPSQSDPSGDTDAMSAASVQLSEMGEDGMLYLVHRLDRTVGGILVFARNKKSAAALSALVSGEGMGKKYLAVCHGKAEEGEYRDYLYRDSALGKAFVVKSARRGAKEAILNLSVMEEAEDMTLVRVTLKTGRFHQIRVQLASRGHSLVGDKKYGSRDQKRRTPCLFSYHLLFELFGKKISLFASPDIDEYPWSRFAIEHHLKEGERDI